MKKEFSVIRVSIGLLIVLLPFGMIYLFLLGYIWTPKAFKFNQVEEWNSPDGKEKVVAYTRLTYPRRRFIDPAGMVRIERINEDGTLEASFECLLREIDQYRGLQIEWDEGIPILLTPEYGWPEEANQLALETP